MLDYKIKELRRQMEPKENEIKAMKEQISKVQCKGLLAGSNGKAIYQDCCTVVVCCVVTIKRIDRQKQGHAYNMVDYTFVV